MSQDYISEENFVYVQPEVTSYGYGHFTAYFRLRPSIAYGESIEVKLSSQCGSGVDLSPSYDRDPSNLYAIRFETTAIPFERVDDLAKYKRKLDRALQGLPSFRAEDGIEEFFATLNAALDAWGIQHGHLFERTTDHRSIPATPYFGNLKKPSGRVAYISAARKVFETEVAGVLRARMRLAA